MAADLRWTKGSNESELFHSLQDVSERVRLSIHFGHRDKRAGATCTSQRQDCCSWNTLIIAATANDVIVASEAFAGETTD